MKKIEEKKLSKWVLIFFGLGVIFAILIGIGIEKHLDVANSWFFYLMTSCLLTGVVLKFIEVTKIFRREKKLLKEGKQISIG